jgi:hypothetical protein
MSQTPRSLSPAVYRRRRIVSALVLALLVGLIWAGVNAAGSWFAAAPSPEEVALPEGVNESSVVVESGQPCPPGTVTVIAKVGDINHEPSESELKAVLETLQNSLYTDPSAPVRTFTKGGINGSFCLSTNIEGGIRTNILTDSLPSTTYRDLNELLPYHLDITSEWGTQTNLFGIGAFHDNNNDTYLARELKSDEGRDYVNYYCRLDFNGLDGDEQADFTPKVGPLEQGINLNVLDPTLNSTFGCSDQNATFFYRISQRDFVYHYYGLIPGRTAIDKLRKQFFLN